MDRYGNLSFTADTSQNPYPFGQLIGFQNNSRGAVYNLSLTTGQPYPASFMCYPYQGSNAPNVSVVNIPERWNYSNPPYYLYDVCVGGQCPVDQWGSVLLENKCDVVFAGGVPKSGTSYFSLQWPFDQVTTNSVVPYISFQDVIAVGQTATATVTLSPSPSPAAVTLNLAPTTGTGSAVFASNNGTSMNITQSGPVQIRAVQPSSAQANIQLSASVNGIQRLVNFTVMQFQVQGNPFIFVGNDPALVTANKYLAMNGSGQAAQPLGGTFTVTSSDATDTYTTGSLVGIPWVSVNTGDQSNTNLDRALTFTYTLSLGGNASQTMNVTARQFAYLQNDMPVNACGLAYGTDYTYTYTVFTHPDGAAVDGNSNLGGTAAKETFSVPPPCGTITGDASLDSNGQFRDHVSSLCSTTPLTCSGTTTQTFKVGGFQVRTNTLTWSSTGVTYTNNGPNQ
jgi:hypothetical protein